MDAGHRSVVIQTYLSMLRKKQIEDSPENRELLLKAIFRSTATGIVKDDAFPPSIWAMPTSPGKA
jgi:hypothetical protein